MFDEKVGEQPEHAWILLDWKILRTVMFNVGETIVRRTIGTVMRHFGTGGCIEAT